MDSPLLPDSLIFKAQRMHAKGSTDAEIAAELGIEVDRVPGIVRPFIPKKVKTWTGRGKRQGGRKWKA